MRRRRRGSTRAPLVTPGDAVRTALTTAAAQTVDPNYVVTPVALYFFSATSSLFLAAMITLVVEFVLAKRKDFIDDPVGDEAEREALNVHLTPVERRTLRLTGITFLLFVAAVSAMLLMPGSPLRGKNGSIVQSVVVLNIGVFIALLLTVLGIVYGRTVGSILSLSAIPKIMAEGVSRVAPVIVLFFAVSQFLAYFKWTGVGSVLTVGGADLLRSLSAPHAVILLTIVLAISLLNMLITSGSAMWSILAPILVPMMMYINMAPEAAMVAFQIGDSVTNPVTPMNAYIVLALGYVQQYRKNAGIGTLMSFTVPVAAVILVAWSAYFMIWYGLGIPLGPGVHLK